MHTNTEMFKKACMGDKKTVYFLYSFGASPSGKAAVFGTAIRGFESSRPSQSLYCIPFLKIYLITVTFRFGF